jgi:predicted phosphodiesterase
MIRSFDCLILIGDIHLSSARPGRRKENDAEFSAKILGKVEQAVEIANRLNGLPILLGDVFDKPIEPEEALKTKLIRILRKARHRPIVNVGNHDKVNTTLSDGDSLAFFGESGIVDLIRTSGPVETVLLGGTPVGIGGTPHDQEIPTDVTGMFPDAKGVVWITHHDLGFEGAYPGAEELFEMKGCSLVVNGHMHLLKPPVRVGRTNWFNPGSLTRCAIDAIHHAPSVWKFTLGDGLERIEIQHDKDVFDLTGRLVKAQGPDKAKVAADRESAFVELLKNESGVDLARSADGSLLREQIEEKFRREGTSPEVQVAILNLLRRVVT